MPDSKQKLEARAAGDLAMWWRGHGMHDLAEGWSRECAGRDYRMPLPGVDCSWNYGPCLRAGRGDWKGLRRALEHYWAHGAGNEFMSPLYTARVFTAAALGALLRPANPWLVRFLRRWIGFLALQAIPVPAPGNHRAFWAGEDVPLRSPRTGHGLALPSTGMRVNGAALGAPLVEPLLAHVLGIDHKMRNGRAWRAWSPPERKADWGKPNAYNPPQPWALLHTIRAAEALSGLRICKQPWATLCRQAVQGDKDAWERVAGAVGDSGVPLPHGLDRFLIQRSPDGVLTAWEGKSPTRQKPSVPASSIVRGKRQVLVVAKWQIPSTQTVSHIEDTHVYADGDTDGILPLLRDADRSCSFPVEP